MGRIGLVDSIKRYFSYPTEQERAQIFRRLRSVKKWYNFEDILVVNLEKQVVLSLGSDVGLCPEHAQVLDDALKQRRPLWTPLHSTHDYLFPHASVIVPLLDDKGSRNPIGALVLVSDAAQFLYPLIQSWPIPSDTAETLLVRQDGTDVLFLNDLRHQKDTALKLRIPLSRKDLPAAKVVKGTTGIVKGKDYRGVEVIAAILPVPDSPWFMVSKVDASEAFAEWHFRSIIILVFILGMMVLIVATGLLIWQRNLKTHFKERYQAAVTLNKALNLHRITLHSIGDAVITTDDKGHVELMNPVAETLTGWHQWEAKGKDLNKIFHIIDEKTRQPIDDPVEKVLKEKKVVELTNHTLLINKDGREFPILDSGAPIIMDDGQIAGVVLVFQDDSRRRESQKIIKENEKKYRSLIEYSSDHIFMLNLEGIYITSNDRIDAFDIQSGKNLVGKSLKEVYEPSVALFYQSKLNQVVTQETPVDFEHEMNTPTGLLYHHDTLYPIYRDDQLWAIGGICRDITEQRRLEKEHVELQQKLHQSQKMEAIGTLAGGIAHDFNNILSSILGFSQLALEKVEKNTELEDDLQEILTAGNRARDLVKQILTFARKSEEKTKPLQPGIIIKEISKFLRSSIPTSIEIRQTIHSDSFIMGNPTQIHQILMNLCTNAAHAMEDHGGVLELSIQDLFFDPGSKKETVDLKPGDYIQIKVSDTGTGIPDKIINSIFDPYFTTKKPGEGTGMGLSVVHGIVETYGGKITADSTPGKGSTFTIYLPITKKRHLDHVYKPEELPAGSEKILYVDDEAAIAKMGKRMLEQIGYSIETRTDSLDALELFRSKPNDFDLVITDMTMPRMTGDVLASEVMGIRPDIPVILCTGFSKKIFDESTTDIGIKAIVNKPFKKAKLAKTIRMVLDEAKSENMTVKKSRNRVKN
ncbi:MAG: PAS domain S-box protein [Desulfotignum sp.]|nr:PAS domain S-box protein [Desulfotignum sp.]MCF8089965.1 PAS domain S-box protein [Desulfotignum sp.]MCF8137042.1 PAS domain S-box protein [Desulfotignum sp.]